VIHVAGTNGKGSVCAYLSAVLTEAGYRVGRYTSPHLVDWNERICLNEQPISTEALRELLLQVQAAIPENSEDSPTQFEVITAACLVVFCPAAGGYRRNGSGIRGTTGCDECLLPPCHNHHFPESGTLASPWSHLS
jgi:hypothetical protein